MISLGKSFLVVLFLGSMVGAQDYDAFHQSLDDGDTDRSLALGQGLYQELAEDYRGDANFRAFDSKFLAAEFLTKQMVEQLQQATGRQMLRESENLFSAGGKTLRPLALPSARQFYDRSKSLFSHPIRLASLTDSQQKFLVAYYDFTLRLLIARIAGAGQALAIAEPAFHQTHHYALVLPLLHTWGDQAVGTTVLPGWMQKRAQLALLSDVFLLHFNLGVQAMLLAQQGADESFSPKSFYRRGAKKCGVGQAHVAVACLEKALGYVESSEVEETCGLYFEIAQLWWDSENYPPAAGRAQYIMETYPESKEFGQAVHLYYDSLSKGDDAEAILAGIDSAIDDERCVAYQAKLMYLKWWALRRESKDDAGIRVIEQEMLENFSEDPLVASMLFGQAIDSLGRQDYAMAQELLEKLIREFPQSQESVQAKKMMVKFKASAEQGG